MHWMRIAPSGVESVIAFVAIAYDRSAKVGSEYIHSGLIGSVANLKKYDVRSAKTMKVAVDSLEPPTSLVAMNDVSIGNLQLQNGCQTFGFVRKTLSRTDNSARRKRKAESRQKETTNFSKRHSERVLQLGRNCDGIWPQGGLIKRRSNSPVSLVSSEKICCAPSYIILGYKHKSEGTQQWDYHGQSLLPNASPDCQL